VSAHQPACESSRLDLGGKGLPGVAQFEEFEHSLPRRSTVLEDGKPVDITTAGCSRAPAGGACCGASERFCQYPALSHSLHAHRSSSFHSSYTDCVGACADKCGPLCSPRIGYFADRARIVETASVIELHTFNHPSCGVLRVVLQNGHAPQRNQGDNSNKTRLGVVSGVVW